MNWFISACRRWIPKFFSSDILALPAPESEPPSGPQGADEIDSYTASVWMPVGANGPAGPSDASMNGSGPQGATGPSGPINIPSATLTYSYDPDHRIMRCYSCGLWNNASAYTRCLECSRILQYPPKNIDYIQEGDTLRASLIRVTRFAAHHNIPKQTILRLLSQQYDRTLVQEVIES